MKKTTTNKASAKKKSSTKTSAKTPAKKPAISADAHKYEAGRPSPKRRGKAPSKTPRSRRKGADIDDLGELPRSYGHDRIFVVAQEPHWLFCYWDYTLVEDQRGSVYLRHGRKGKDLEGEVEVPRETNSWYLSVRDADADYVVELGCYVRGKWKTLTRSATVLTPSDTLAGLGEPLFANMPFHVTFQDLVEKLRGEMRRGESLAEALGRLQKRGEIPLARLSSAQRIALDTLLQTNLGSLTSGDLGRFLSSSGASLFSGGFASSSWAGAASWAEAPGGFSSGFLALMGLVGSSWGTSSWSGAAGSWSAAASSSWGAESSWLSSWRSAPRDFFMHVNAEVIFYGGTHPEATVAIDGQQVALRPDGTFRYHFVLPDGEFEIPIVATSPDGLETRRAVLKFERATARHGDVGATTQPLIPAPMGRKK
ncbi:MAG: DUF4912 domain-containing protein [Chthoniobacterales bacterium]|jgi:hypothetical protein